MMSGTPISVGPVRLHAGHFAPLIGDAHHTTVTTKAINIPNSMRRGMICLKHVVIIIVILLTFKKKEKKNTVMLLLGWVCLPDPEIVKKLRKGRKG
jgi:hypothetical protein